MLITGNGEYLAHSAYDLNIAAISSRFEKYFDRFYDYYFGWGEEGEFRILEIKEHNIRLILADWFYDIPKIFKEELSKTTNFEKSMGKVIDEMLKHVGCDQFSERFIYLYKAFSEIILGLLFMEQIENVERKTTLDNINVDIFTFNYPMNDFPKGKRRVHLHGSVFLKNKAEIAAELMGKSELHRTHMTAQLCIESIVWNDNDPVLFGSSISQKEQVNKILKGYNEDVWTSKLKDEYLKKLTRKAKKIVFPYERLTEASKNSDVYIMGLDISSHREIFNYISTESKNIYVYVYDEKDQNVVEELNKELPNLSIQCKVVKNYVHGYDVIWEGDLHTSRLIIPKIKGVENV